ncbi:MAG: hypothetical protein H0U59_00795, partial [Gemmatimonadaceae bacterium]|nr:hypothetical protein [Gemmatimonadaceae bacterium]
MLTLIALLCAAMVGCTAADAPQPAAGSQATDTQAVPGVSSTAGGGHPVLGTEDSGTSGAPGAATPAAQTISDQLRQEVALQDVEAACLTSRLDALPALRDALGSDPRSSPRHQELTDLAADCVRATTGAVNWVNGIQEQANGKLTAVQLECLRDGYARLDRDTTKALAAGGLDPGGNRSPEAESAINAIFSGCS